MNPQANPEPQREDDGVPTKEASIWPEIPKKGIRLDALKDPLEFVANKCSKNARKVNTEATELKFDIWVDKHLHIRQQLGDKHGKRVGIEPAIVGDLVSRAIGHLIYYSNLAKGFAFLNCNGFHSPAIRVLLKDSCGEDLPLNVLIEAHSGGIGSYEITIITALRINDFNMSEGQYMVEFHADGSTLWKRERTIWANTATFNLED